MDIYFTYSVYCQQIFQATAKLLTCVHFFLKSILNIFPFSKGDSKATSNISIYLLLKLARKFALKEFYSQLFYRISRTKSFLKFNRVKQQHKFYT